MDNPEFMKVGDTRHDLRELKVIEERVRGKLQGNNEQAHQS